ncbi:hypothetical protein [Yoonia sp. 2307UL14-13]|uniref:hypothetical protein n=1 Tax=Yoonia sp. 2307UL14-13 TaxID=3126506 RepID=UPI0030AEDEFC
MADTNANSLLELLGDERVALKHGDFATLQQLLERKTTLMNRLLRTPIDQHTALRVRDALEKNHQLLSAAQAGILAARDRISALEAIGRGMNVYDQSGHVASVEARQGNLFRKA